MIYNVVMAQSTLRTTVAVLRTLLGLTVEEFAPLTGKSVSTIQSIEAGKRLKLTKDTAQKIAFETGVSLDWLLAGDVTVEPYSSLEDPTGRPIPYSRTVFELIQSAKYKTVPKHSLENIQFNAILMTAGWFPIFASAVNRGEGDLAAFVMDDHLKEMSKRFGYDEKAAEELSGKAKFITADGHTFAFVYKEHAAQLPRTDKVKITVLKETGTKRKLVAAPLPKQAPPAPQSEVEPALSPKSPAQPDEGGTWGALATAQLYCA